jgi:hypothetical protein
MWHTSVFPNSVNLKCTSGFGGYAIDVHGAITALGSDILVEWVPSDSLHIVEMLRDLVYTFT